MRSAAPRRRPAFRDRTLERLQRYLGVHVSCLVVRNLARRGPADDGDFTFRLLRPDEALALCADPAWDIDEPMVRDAFTRDGVCVGAFREGRTVGYSWYAYEDTPYDGDVWVHVPAHAAYRYKTFVHEDARGDGLGRRLFLRGSELAHRPGRDHAFGLVALHNAASLAASGAAAFEPAGTIAYWHSGSLFLARHSPQAAALGVRLHRRP